MNNNGNISVKIIQMPIETDEHGNPKNIDLSSVIKHLHEQVPDVRVNKTPSNPMMTVPTPRQIFEQASEFVLYQPNALRQLATQFYYHLSHQKERLSAKNGKPEPKYDKAHMEQVAKVLGFNEEFLAHLDKMSENDIKNLIELEKTDPAAAQAFIDNYPIPKRVDNHAPTAPIFLTGKTGSGKTHMIKQLCKLFDVNFVAVNAASISNAGYKGMTLADIGTSLLQSAGNDMVRAEHSVVFFDEFDKLFINGSEQIGAYHLSLVTEILTIIEGTTAFPVKDDGGIDSSHMLFILGGSFNIHQKKERTPIGFMNEKSLQDVPDSQLKLTDFGLPDELAGRIGKIISLEEIGHDEMVEILLKSPTSPFTVLQNQLAMVHCSAEINPQTLAVLAKSHADSIEKFGVRGLYQAFHGLPQLTNVLHDAPEHPYSHYVITPKSYVRVQKPIPKKPAAPVVESVTTTKTNSTPPKPSDDYDDMPF